MSEKEVDIQYELNRIRNHSEFLVEEIHLLENKIEVLENIIDHGGLHQANKIEALIFGSRVNSNYDFHLNTINNFCDKIQEKISGE